MKSPQTKLMRIKVKAQIIFQKPADKNFRPYFNRAKSNFEREINK